MIITKLVIENFMSIGEARLLMGERGLVLIQGSNEDDTSATSNGAGKSTIPDSISWCLFGETARGESGDSIVNRTVGKNCRVQLYVHDESADNGYVITRHRKHKEEKNRLTVHLMGDAGAVDLTGGTDKITQSLVEQIIGCSKAVFDAAIYAGQERMPNLPMMTDKQLKELIEEAAGITEIQTYLAKAREELATAKGEHDTLAGFRMSTIERKRIQEERLDSHKSLSAEWEARRDLELKSIETKLKVLGSASDLEFAANLEDITVREASARIDALTKEMSKPDAAREALRVDLSKAEKALSAIETKVRMVAADLKRDKAASESLDALIGTPCKECGKPYHEEDLETARKARRAGLKERVDAYKGLQEALSEARIARDTAQSAYDSHVSDESEKTVIADELAAMKKKMVDAIKRREGFTTSLNEVVELNKQSIKLSTGSNPFTSKIAEVEKQIGLLEDSIRETDANIDALSEKLALYEQAVEVFSPAGVRAHILDNVTPYLNTKTAQYLTTLSDGNLSATWSTLSTTAKGELREKFVIEVSHAKGGDSFGLLSGGEKRKVRLSCALALQDLVATRAHKPFRLFVADEIDDALDASGLERLMTILDEKARERGTVLVISHNELSDWIRDVATVVKRGGVSTVEGALS